MKHVPFLLRYGLVILSVAVALLIRQGLALIVGELPPFLLFFPTIVLVAMFLGFGPGIVATALSAMAANYFLMAPRYQWHIENVANALALGMFAGAGMLISWMARRLDQVRQQSAEAAARERSQKELIQAGEEVERQRKLLVRALAESERHRGQLEAVLQAMSDGLVVFDMKGRAILINQAEAKICGYASPEAMERDLEYYARTFELRDLEGNLIPVEQWPVSRVLRGESVLEWELRGRRRDTGREWYFSFTGEPVWNEQGQQVLAVTITRDITERKQAEEAVRDSQEKLAAALASMTDAVFISDAEGRFIDFNDAFVTFHRFKSRDDCARTLAEYPDILDKFLPDGTLVPLDRWAVPRALRGETVTNVEYGLRRKDIGETWVGSYSFGPIRNQDGTIMGAVVVARDVTKYRQAERALQESEAELRFLFEHALDAVFLTVPDGRILAANPAACELFGMTEAEIIGLGREGLSDQADPRHAAGIAERARTGRVRTEARYRRKDGTVFEADVQSVILGDEAKRAFVIMRDITARKQAEEALRASEARYRTLVEGINLGINLIGPDHTLLATNMAQSRMSKADIHELVGQRCHVAFQASNQTCPDCPGLRAMANGEPAEIEHAGHRIDGSPFFVRVQAFPLTGPDGKSGGFIEVVEDITERRRLENQFRQSQKMEAIGQLAGGVAHDFRNQLTVIKGFSDLLLRRSLVKEAGRENLLEILKAVERSSLLTGQLLAFSRTQTLEPRKVDLSEVITDVSRGLHRMIGEDVQLELVLGSPPCVVEIDPDQLQQALFNLAANARDAMPKGGRLMIETSQREADEAFLRRHPDAKATPHVAVAVHDTGCGIDEETRGRLFEPFFTTKEVGQGTGLGLAMVYGFVKQSEGIIEVESQVGIGSTFTLFFPVCSTYSQEPAGKSRTGEKLPTGTETLLVVEDEPSVRRMLVASFQELGYTVLEADCADKAMDLIRRGGDNINLVITDIVMPGSSGVELVGEIAKERPEMAVLYMSGYPEKELTKRGAMIDPRRIMAKPCDHATLMMKVREILDAREEAKVKRQRRSAVSGQLSAPNSTNHNNAAID